MEWINNMTRADIAALVVGLVVVAVEVFALACLWMRKLHRKRRLELAERAEMLSPRRPSPAPPHLHRSAGGPVSASPLASPAPQRTTTTPRASDGVETFAESSPSMRSAWPMWTDDPAPASAPAFASGGGGASSSWSDSCSSSTSSDTGSSSSDSGSSSCSSD